MSGCVRRLGAADAALYRALRLQGLLDHPEAFAASWDHEASMPDSWFAERLERTTVFGSWQDDATLTGAAGFYVQAGAKSQHKGVLFGMFVRPEFRGRGVAASLLARLIQHAACVVEELQLSVVTSNAAAVRLYASAGFREYGLERRALKVGDAYHDEFLMALAVRPTK